MPTGSATSSERGEYARFNPNSDIGPKEGVEQHKAEITSDPDKRPTDIRSWRAPVVMLISLAIGLGIAFSHHALGLRLNNRPVADVSLSQAWIFRFSTALAFLVKVAFATSIGTAYVQHQWLRLRQQTFRTNEVDALTSVLGSLFSFLSSAVWLKHPILTLMALISWFTPLAAIVAPGSLTVSPMPSSTIVDAQVPQLDLFNSAAFGTHGYGPNFQADVKITNLAYQVAMSGEPIEMDTPFVNSTYHLDFDGPAVKCASANDSIVANCTRRYGTNEYRTRASIVSFVSWTGPFTEDAGTKVSWADQGLDADSQDAARLSVMTNRGYTAWDKYLKDDPDNELSWQRIVNVTECLLHNASYSVDFAFHEGVQSQELEIVRWRNPIRFNDSYWDDGTDPHAAVMQAFGSMLAGQVSTSYAGSIATEQMSSMGFQMMDFDVRDDPTIIQQKLEQMFQTMTLSLLSVPEFLKNSSTAEWVPVEVSTWPVTYVYTMSGLLIAYGTAFLCALGCSVLGLYAYFTNDASYQNLFSTYVRAAHDTDLQSHLVTGDNGADPLPKALARTSVAFGGYTCVEDTEGRNAQQSQSGDTGSRLPSLDETGPPWRPDFNDGEGRRVSVSPDNGSLHPQTTGSVGAGSRVSSEAHSHISRPEDGGQQLQRALSGRRQEAPMRFP